MPSCYYGLECPKSQEKFHTISEGSFLTQHAHLLFLLILRDGISLAGFRISKGISGKDPSSSDGNDGDGSGEVATVGCRSEKIDLHPFKNVETLDPVTMNSLRQ